MRGAWGTVGSTDRGASRWGSSTLHKRKNRLILGLSLLLVAGFLLTSLASYFVSLASLRKQIVSHELPLTRDSVYSEVQRDLLRPVFLASLMAHDTFLRDWVTKGEKSPEEVTRYLKEIQEEYGAFTSFFVSDRTRISTRPTAFSRP